MFMLWFLKRLYIFEILKPWISSMTHHYNWPELTVVDFCLLLLYCGERVSMFSSDVAFRMLHWLLFWLLKSSVLDQLLTSDCSRSRGRLPSCWGELPMMPSGGTVMWCSGTDSSAGGFSSSLLAPWTSRLNEGRRSLKLLCRSENKMQMSQFDSCILKKHNRILE